MDTHSRELLDAQLGGMDCGELSLAAQLQGKDHSLTQFDRACFSAAFLLDWQGAGEQRHWLMRAKDNLRHELIERLAPGDALIRMPVSQRARQLHPHLPSHWQARLIEVDVGGRRRRFITSLQDHRAYPARALAELYRQRSAGTLPKQLAALLAQSRHFVPPPRRTERSFPRVVKNRAHKFPTKKCLSGLN